MYTATGKLLSKDVFTYDTKGNHLYEAHYGPGGSVKSRQYFKYEYDAMGNWTQRMTFERASNRTGPHPVEVEYREIPCIYK